MITGSCHCGAVQLEIAEPPATATSCNCSICRRIGGYWAYYTKNQVRITGDTIGYVHGDRTLAFHHCPACGCTTHWWSISPNSIERCAVNMAMFDPAVMEGITVRKFDGAESWTYLED